MLGYDSYITATLEILFEERMKIYLFQKAQLEWPVLVDAIAESQRGNLDKWNEVLGGWFDGGYAYSLEEEIPAEPSGFPQEYISVGPGKAYATGEAVLTQIQKLIKDEEPSLKFWQKEYDMWRRNWGVEALPAAGDGEVNEEYGATWKSGITGDLIIELEGSATTPTVHLPGAKGWNYVPKNTKTGKYYGPEDQSQVSHWCDALRTLLEHCLDWSYDSTVLSYYRKNLMPAAKSGKDFNGDPLVKIHNKSKPDDDVMVSDKSGNNLKWCNRVWLAKGAPMQAAHHPSGWKEDSAPEHTGQAYWSVHTGGVLRHIDGEEKMAATLDGLYWGMKCSRSVRERKAVLIAISKRIAQLNEYYSYAAHIHNIKVETGGFLDSVDKNKQKLFFLAATILAAADKTNKNAIVSAKDEKEMVQIARQKLKDMFEKKLYTVGFQLANRLLKEIYADEYGYKTIAEYPKWGNNEGFDYEQGAINDFLSKKTSKFAFGVTSDLNVIGDADTGASVKKYGETIDSIIFDLVDSI